MAMIVVVVTIAVAVAMVMASSMVAGCAAISTAFIVLLRIR